MLCHQVHGFGGAGGSLQCRTEQQMPDLDDSMCRRNPKIRCDPDWGVRRLFQNREEKRVILCGRFTQKLVKLALAGKRSYGKISPQIFAVLPTSGSIQRVTMKFRVERNDTDVTAFEH